MSICTFAELRVLRLGAHGHHGRGQGDGVGRRAVPAAAPHVGPPRAHAGTAAAPARRLQRQRSHAGTTTYTMRRERLIYHLLSAV